MFYSCNLRCQCVVGSGENVFEALRVNQAGGSRLLEGAGRDDAGLSTVDGETEGVAAAAGKRRMRSTGKRE